MNGELLLRQVSEQAGCVMAGGGLRGELAEFGAEPAVFGGQFGESPLDAGAVFAVGVGVARWLLFFQFGDEVLLAPFDVGDQFVDLLTTAAERVVGVGGGVLA